MDIRKPQRATRTGSFRIEQPADKVFPLYCPVVEADWLESWSPEAVYTDTGRAERECVFTTTGETGTATWIVTDYDADALTLRMVKVTPDLTALVLDINVDEIDADSCMTTVTYSHTALSERGVEFVRGFTEDAYAQLMTSWKEAIDYYFEHAKALPGT